VTTVIESEPLLVLSLKESLRILDLIENPPPKNDKFLAAMARSEQQLKSVASNFDDFS
jgi:uncharacterized protein (DUF1778 family)